MLRRLFLLPVLAIAGTCTLALSAKAQTVNFSGQVPDSCAWGIATDGQLQYDPATPNILTSDDPTFPFPATIEITCPSGGGVIIADPVPGTNPMTTTNKAWVIGANGTAYSPAGSGAPVLSITASTVPETLDVHMEASTTNPSLDAGTYTFTVTLTASP
ncbi:MAG: hypothetical protein AB4290_02350 [Spirulina sp.]